MKIQIPTNCPVCDYPLIRINDQLFCQSKTCSAQVNKKIENFAKVLGIKGLGEKTIEKISLNNITDLYLLTFDSLSPILGEKLSIKLLREIERSKASSFPSVLAAMSIPLIGSTAASKLATEVNSFDDITPEICQKVGLGEKTISNLFHWLATDYLEIKDLLPFTFDNNNNNNSIVKSLGTVCITGKLSSYKNKTEAKLELENLGYTVVDTLTKSVTILIDEENKGSSKRKTAEERGIQIISNLKQFIGK
jgi:NAD-dependent DNA ligase